MEMKKIFFIVVTTLFLNGCFQMVAFAPSVLTGAATGKMTQSTLSYVINYGVKEATGKTTFEHVFSSFKKDKEIAKNIHKDDDLLNSFDPYSSLLF